MEIRIGISGWRYPPWRGVFYPQDLPQNQELHYASRQVNSIEINGSFYSLQTPASYKKWHNDVPDDFIFSVKGPRYITHIRRLKDSEPLLGNFFASGVLHLREKLGPFLWQLPPSFQFDDERLESFFKLLPHTFAEAIQQSSKADRLEPDFPKDLKNSSLRLRHAIEVRNHTFENPDFIALLRKYNIALVFADTAGRWPYMEDLTSDFIYLRLHGDEELYASGYGEETLRWWAARLKKWISGSEPSDTLTLEERKLADHKAKDMFLYFDNDVKVRAPVDAITLMRLLHVQNSNHQPRSKRSPEISL